ncbi:MAG: EamA family transporter [Opitutaceae bacterium]|nr:EamA family transporter [Opitutaceae bacterium]
MSLLLLASFIWAFSFGLLKQLTGLESDFIAAARLGLALLVFLPFLRWRGLTARTTLAFVGIGAVQFGFMYLAYIESFHFLLAYEVALFTLTTPILVTLFADALDRVLRLSALYAAMLAVIGTAIITVKSATIGGTLTGLGLVQLSNAAFAIGQVLYRRMRTRHSELRDRDIFGLLYAGAFAVTLAVTLTHVNFASVSLTPKQAGTLLYLGAVASGLGFFLWNVGATRVSAGTLAVMNNAKIPLAVACSLLFFGESTDLPRLLIGGGMMLLAVRLAARRGAA